MGAIQIKRAYEPPHESDGERILVDRLWPRGLRKDAARLAMWAKDAAPSTELRKWYDHDTGQWAEFRRRYLRELSSRRAATDGLVELVRAGRTLTFVYACRDERHNHARVLSEYVLRRARSAKPQAR